jgi:diaminopimelate decarboxylase
VTMAGFGYRGGVLAAERVALTALADLHGTPAYVYSAGGMRGRLRELQEAFAGRRVLFCYAVKANSRLAVIRTLADAGAGADVVSGGELERALAAGVDPARIVFAGLGKTGDELRAALVAGIAQFNVESLPELHALGAIARAMGRRAPIAFRVNPDVDAGTHAKISTGRRGDKFGIPAEEAHEAYRLAAGLEGIEPVGLHLHIGSQIQGLGPFEAAYRKGAELARSLLDDGIALRRLDLGGGFGARYREDDPPFDARAFARMVAAVTDGLGLELVFEPGRALVAEAGVLLARVIYVKRGGGRRFVVLDAGMNVLVRVAMYDAYHAVLPVVAPADGVLLAPADVVGPICESSDVFARERLLPPLEAGDLVALTGAGAYGAVMASDYNSRPGAAELLVDGERHALIKPRRLPADQLADEVVPDWHRAAVPAAS